MVYARVLNFPWFYYNRSLAMYYPTNYPSIKNSLKKAPVYSFNCNPKNNIPVPKPWDKPSELLPFTPSLIHI